MSECPGSRLSRNESQSSPQDYYIGAVDKLSEAGTFNVEMGPVELLVMLRTADGQLIVAPVEVEGTRVFAVLHIYGPKGTYEVVAKERIELDVRYLEKMDRRNGAHLLYKKEFQLPDPKMN